MNAIPGNLIAPLVAFDVTSGGQFEQIAPMVLYGHKTSAGEATLDAEVAVTTVREARRLFGKGSMLEQMVAIARKNAPTHPIKAVAVTETGTAEIRTITVDASPNTGAAYLSIMGEVVSLTIATGASASAVATALAAAINSYDNPQTQNALPFTASASSAVVTITARHKGAYAAEIDIHIPNVEGGNAFTGKLTFATTTDGSGVPDTSAANAAISETDWSTLVSPFGDATNVGRYAALAAARWVYDNQLYGHVWYPLRDTQSNLISAGDAKDDWHLSIVPTFSAGGFAQPSFLWVCGIVSRVVSWLSSGSNGDVSRNQTALKISGLTGPRDATYRPDLATRNAFYAAGVSGWSVDANGDVVIDKLVTTVKTIGGTPDVVFRDVQRPYQLMYALRFMRARVESEHRNKAITDENKLGLPSLVTPSDVEATIVHAYRDLTDRGVLEKFATALNLISVSRNLDNPNRLDAVVPMDFTNPLDIFAGLARVYAEF